MKSIRILPVLIAVSFATAHADESKLVDASDPKRIATLLQDEGYKAKIDVDEDGKITINSAANGADFQIYFQACSNGATECEILAFSAGFDLNQAVNRSLISDWNRTRWSKSYRDDEGDPFLEFNVNAVHGVSEENFRDTLNWYTRELGEFVDLIGWNEPKQRESTGLSVEPI